MVEHLLATVATPAFLRYTFGVVLTVFPVVSVVKHYCLLIS